MKRRKEKGRGGGRREEKWGEGRKMDEREEKQYQVCSFVF
jgi:hypothetical protein